MDKQELLDSLDHRIEAFKPLGSRKMVVQDVVALLQQIRLDVEQLPNPPVEMQVEEKQPNPDPRLREFEIWSEGYRASGDQGTATFHGTGRGLTFKDACIAYFARRSKAERDSFSAERMTYWNCRLFDNEADACKSFG